MSFSCEELIARPYSGGLANDAVEKNVKKVYNIDNDNKMPCYSLF